MHDNVLKVIQIFIALGLLNVWVLRANRSTAYRGGDAKTLRDEFTIYGLPSWFCSFVGVLKIGAAVLLLAGLWYPMLVLPTATVVCVLMLGAISMHLKVHDSIKKVIPAAFMFAVSFIVCGVWLM